MDTASALLLARDAVMLTESSGRLVPMATMVMPMISEGTFSRLATEELPSTKKSAPLSRRINPASRTAAAFAISKTLFSCH